ncbi:MAG TPA: M23 family metallopeptidase, partial [Beijerinckiaceae bacterium]|nr:M23 family metallopeptidase [Beijerinckiaceae bacterium]
PAAPRAPRYEPLDKPVAAAPQAPRAPRYESLSDPSPNKLRPTAKDSQRAPVAKASKPKVADDDDDDEPATVKAAPKAAAAPAASAGKPTAAQTKAGFKPLEKSQTAAKATTKSSKVASNEDDDAAPAAPKSPVKAAKVEAPKSPAAKADVESTASLGADSQEFRWPARGRVISGYGAKGPNGTNDGINIAVPEGTPVKAAETGTVAYAGEEIKGYGKMVLIRHPNGFVSAYAHNGDLNVKRGDTVKRGQVIAKSGQTGNVTSPQLHFELRKGSEPVDPSRFLEGH